MTTTTNPVLEALTFRHAAKRFDADRKISEADFAQILEAGRLSPTSFGLELYDIVLLESDESRSLVAKSAWGANSFQTGTPGQIGTASHFGIINAYTGQRARYDSDYLEGFLREVKGFDADSIEMYTGLLEKFMNVEFDLTDDRKLTDWAGKQAYIVLANMLTAAAAMGIDSCPIEGFDQAIVKRILSDDLELDMSYRQPAVLFAFGYRVEEPRYARTRREIADIVNRV